MINYPEPLKNGLKALVGLTDDRFDALVNALSQVSGEISLRRMLQIIGHEASVERPIAFSISFAARFLNENFSRQPDYINELVNMLVTEKFIEDPAKQLAALRLARVQQCKLVKYYLRGMNLMTRNPRNFRSARAITEMRPIFLDGVDDAPVAHVIEHQVEIKFNRSGASNEEKMESFFISVDATDIDELIGVLSRCQLRSKAIETQLTSTNVAFMKATN